MPEGRCSLLTGREIVVQRILRAFVASAFLLSGPAAHALGAERLEDMVRAAEQLAVLGQEKAKSRESMDPSLPEPARLLALICWPGEAEELQDIAIDRFRDASRYLRAIGTVMTVYGKAGERSASQQQITDYTRALGSCFDAALWSTRMAIELTDRMVAKNPRLLENPKAREGLANVRGGTADFIEATLSAFQLRGIGSAWCEARQRPLLATVESAARTMSQEVKQKLRDAARSAEVCGPAIKGALETIQRKLTP